MCCAKSVSGTNAHWNHVKDDLKSIITQVEDLQQFSGLCHVLTFTGQNFKNSTVTETSNSERRENVINNPHMLDGPFTECKEQFFKYYFSPAIQIYSSKRTSVVEWQTQEADQTTPMCPCKRKYGYLSNAQKLRES